MIVPSQGMIDSSELANDQNRLFNPNTETIGDLVQDGDTPTHEQIAVGRMALDDYYNGGKDGDENGAIVHVFRAMTAIEHRSARKPI